MLVVLDILVEPDRVLVICHLFKKLTTLDFCSETSDDIPILKQRINSVCMDLSNLFMKLSPTLVLIWFVMWH